MIGEFMSRENVDCGEQEEGGCDGRILGMMNGTRLRANVYAPAAVLGE